MSHSTYPSPRQTERRASSIARAALQKLRDLIAPRAGDPTGRASSGRFAFCYENVLGTSFELQLIASHAAVARRAESAALAEVDRLARILSGYEATSELSRFLCSTGEHVPVSPVLADVLDAAEHWRIATNGAFDPAAVSLVELLRDPDGSRRSESIDDLSRRRALNARLRELDQPLWDVDRTRGTARRVTQLKISLDALAKGYIVDRVAERARSIDGIAQVLLNIGGDLRHIGSNALTVGIASPHAPADNAPPLALVQLADASLATSGGYRRGFVSNGRRVSHILDPRTGRPAARIASASVIAPDCATADALSTAFSVMTPSESVALADSLSGVACLLVESDGTITTNERWNSRAVVPRNDTTQPRLRDAR